MSTIDPTGEDQEDESLARDLGADAHLANIMRNLDLHSVNELVMSAFGNRIVQA